MNVVVDSSMVTVYGVAGGGLGYVGTISLSGIVTITDTSTVKISATASAPNVIMMGNADDAAGLPKGVQNKCNLNALQIQ